MNPISYKRHRFPPEIIAHSVWLHLRFNLSLRDVQELLFQRWVGKFGPKIARRLRRRQACPGNTWHLDEVVLKIAGRKYWLWRAVDQNGIVLEEILQTKRSKRLPSDC